jgi:ankyrin repeat protein
LHDHKSQIETGPHFNQTKMLIAQTTPNNFPTQLHSRTSTLKINPSLVFSCVILTRKLALIANVCAMCVLQTYDTILHFASSNGNLDVVQYLIEKYGADVHAKNKVSEFD